MRTVTQVLQEMDNEPNEYYRGEILKKYCEEIIDKCGNQLESDGAIQEGWLWQKILKVKKLL